ncbi:hypothetical protein GE061_014823 [Apolygus lucorum]|uniref:Uncharacterized protein n=1 Tax=Apolygus lucorum TaxID=248454 RepID=A0A6A4IVL9_APOLU|nr:hypothetical protein GE061_003874 [Apolygus lucorum]KAF6209080.1 hypothetical protein GE061_014823 [Apolygus lucorum]
MSNRKIPTGITPLPTRQPPPLPPVHGTVTMPVQEKPRTAPRNPENLQQAKDSAMRPLPPPPLPAVMVFPLDDVPRKTLPNLTFVPPPYAGNCHNCCLHGFRLPRQKQTFTQTNVTSGTITIPSSPMTPPAPPQLASVVIKPPQEHPPRRRNTNGNSGRRHRDASKALRRSSPESRRRHFTR